MKSLRTLKTQKAWQLMESAEALQKARQVYEEAEKQLDAARTLQGSIESELARRAQPGALINPAALNWMGRDLQQQRGLVDTAAHAAAEAERNRQTHMQEVANIRFGEKKLDEHLRRLQLNARVEEDKRDMAQLDDMWLQSLMRTAQDGEDNT